MGQAMASGVVHQRQLFQKHPALKTRVVTFAAGEYFAALMHHFAAVCWGVCFGDTRASADAPLAAADASAFTTMLNGMADIYYNARLHGRSLQSSLLQRGGLSQAHQASGTVHDRARGKLLLPVWRFGSCWLFVSECTVLACV